MKIILNIKSIHEREIGPLLFAALRESYPEGVDSAGFFEMRLPETDPRAQKVLKIIESSALVYHADQSAPINRDKEYNVVIYRSYDIIDFELAQLLQIYPRKDIFEDLDRAHSGLLQLDISETGNPLERRFKDKCIVRVQAGPLLVPGQVKIILESEQVKGVLFRPVQPVEWTTDPANRYRPIEWPPGDSEWWELASSVTMPPLAPSMILTDRNGNRLPRGTSNPVGIRDDSPFSGAELHYFRADIEAMEAVDLAQTFEHGPQQPLERRLVASKRFYELCVNQSIRCDWTPVRIDEG